jgi:hypothetical protein
MANGTGFRLGIDFGTSHTTAVLRWPDGHTRPILFEGSPLLPSAVYANQDGTLLVGRDAIHAARLDPARFEPTPKRRIKDAAGAAMVTAVLGRIRDEAVRVAGHGIDTMSVTLTHPANWDPGSIRTLLDAGQRAGLPDPRPVAEPVAAAGYYVAVLGRQIPPGSALVVYDFGGGTFDASVVSPSDGGYRVLAMEGLDDLGGVDLDTALLEYVATTYRDTEPLAWQRLEQPQTPADRRHRRHLIEDVRAAKEMLSRSQTATVPVPLLELEASISRTDFERLARPFLDRTVATTARAIQRCGAPVAALLLVGGSSRIPLVATLLQDGVHLAPSTIDQPETVVAEGSIRLAEGGTGETRAASALPIAGTLPAVGPLAPPVDPWHSDDTLVDIPLPTVPVPPPPVPAIAATIRVSPPVPMYALPVYSGRKRRRWPLAVALVLILAGAGAGAWYGLPYLAVGAPASSPSSTKVAKTPFVRAERPTWMPAGWRRTIDDAAEKSIVEGQATNGGTCTYDGPSVHVERNRYDISGCRATDKVKALVVRDGAIEAEFSVAAGCGGMWMRTGTMGYFVAVCSNGEVQLHRLVNDPPADNTRLGAWRPGFDPKRVVVGLLAQDKYLTIYVDGEGQQVVVDPVIGSGRVGIGGFAPHPADQMDATITRFRAWTPPGTAS